MATKHGNRIYIQVLLDPFRGELFTQDCEAAEIKPSAKIRQLVYDYLVSELPEGDHLAAALQDRKKWREAVESRLAARAASRQQKLNQEESSPTPTPQCASQPASEEETGESSDE